MTLDTFKTRLLRRIDAGGPLLLADYMQACLLDPKDGYYMRGEAFGADGDFITAPEVSQMFGEIIGLSLADIWLQMGQPRDVALVELGPGRGTLMADIVRATSRIDGFLDAVSIHFVEASPALRQQQKSRVPHAQWRSRLEDIPQGPMLLVANEFFDALPIHQFVKTGETWAEVAVTRDDDTLTFAKVPPGPAFLHAPEAERRAEPGTVVEISPASLNVAATIADRLKDQGGAALIIDYGYTAPPHTPTFQALANHQMVDPLAAPGCADLTAHVDFAALARIFMAAGLKTGPVEEQGAYLMARGVGARAQALAAKADAARVLADLKRLVDPTEMGSLFKVLEVRSI